MKLSEIKLINENYRNTISREECIKLLHKHCSDALRMIGHPIIRGMTNNGDFQIIAGEDGHRASKNTTNHYTVILDSVLSNEFPKRSKSIIAASYEARDYALLYGSQYAIFPYNNVKIGVVESGEDIWYTRIKFAGLTGSLEQWNNIFKEANVPDTSFNAIITKLEEIRNFDKTSQLGQLLSTINGSIEDELRRAYTQPFSVTTTASPSYDRGSHEVWISGKCIAIHFPEYLEMIKDLT